MKYVNRKGLDLSVFSLGTVQLGKRYGLGTDADKPSEETAFHMLDTAMELGVNNLDTANNYGDSEKVIGRWLAKRRAEGKELPWVVTKIGPFDQSNPTALRDDILRQAEKCLETLGVDTIDCLMFHGFEDYATDAETAGKTLNDLKAQGVCNMTAISAYSRHDYGVIADSGFDATQIPLNIFDWNQIENGGIEKLNRSGMMIFCRSVFLQGLVFHTPEDLDPQMSFCFPYLRKFNDLCKEFSLSPAALALSFVLSVPGVTTAVMGCDTVKHVESNCALFDQTVTLTQAQLDKLHDAFRGIDPRVINPGMWYNRT